MWLAIEDGEFEIDLTKVCSVNFTREMAGPSAECSIMLSSGETYKLEGDDFNRFMGWFQQQPRIK